MPHAGSQCYPSVPSWSIISNQDFGRHILHVPGEQDEARYFEYLFLVDIPIELIYDEEYLPAYADKTSQEYLDKAEEKEEEVSSVQLW